MSSDDKVLVWLHGEIKTPPFSRQTRLEAGALLRRLQRGERIGMPHARSLPAVGPRCRELRLRVDGEFRADADAIVILDVFHKKTQRTPRRVIESCRRRLRAYDALE